jgi:putative N6-adenine-specific DNA methylase
MERFFATCPRGLESLLAEELFAAGAAEVAEVPGGASFGGDWRVCYAANLHSRIATRILWRVGHGAYRREDDIYRLAHGLPWRQWFSERQTLRVFVTAIRSPLKSLDFITLRIKDAVCDRFRADCGSRPNVDTAAPDVRIHAFLTEREATLYVDTSGEALYKRGFKTASVEAPLKENLAAGILKLTGWRPGETLLDPMCGSGTFLLEAAQIALGIAPGLGRPFGFERLKLFRPELWQPLLSAAREQAQPATPLPLYGADQDPAQIAHAREKLRAAGLEQAVPLQAGDILELVPPAPPGVLVANPPYGVRLADQQALAEFYPRLGDVLKQRYAGWRCYFFTADLRLAKLIGLKAGRRVPLYNGALECRLFEYRMVAGRLGR